MKIKTNLNDFEGLIKANVNGTTAVSIDCITPVKMVKKHRETKEPNPYLGAMKIQTKNGMIGFDYGNSVNNQASRENKEERTTKERAWGILSPDRIFVYHNDTVYLQIKVQSVSNTVYKLGNKTIDYEAIKPYLSSISTSSSTQADLDKEIIINDIKLINIKNMRIMHKEIEIE